jgi:hypothetical protein
VRGGDAHAPLEADQARTAALLGVLGRRHDAALAEEVHPRAAVEQRDGAVERGLVHAAARAARAVVAERRERLARAEERGGEPSCAAPVSAEWQGEQGAHGFVKQMSCAPSVQRVVRSDRYSRQGSTPHVVGSSTLRAPLSGAVGVCRTCRT